MKLHIAVKDSWHPWSDYLKTLSIEECRSMLEEMMMIDHIDDDITNNHLNNLQYSTPFKNSNVIKEWN